MIPQIATITAGGSVNFIISGGHVLAVYDRGTKPKNIGHKIEPNCAFPLPPAGITTPCSPVNNEGVPIAGGILSDPDDRIYRGPFLNVAPPRRDGVEVVQFTKPGTYLVICARKDHFINPATKSLKCSGMSACCRTIGGKTSPRCWVELPRRPVPTEPATEPDHGDACGICRAPWPDMALLIQRQLRAHKEVVCCKCRTGMQAEPKEA